MLPRADTEITLSIAIFCSSLVCWRISVVEYSPAQINKAEALVLQAIGAAVAGVSILTDTESLAILIGGLVITTLSDVIQIRCLQTHSQACFQNMAPLHHQNSKGWKEITIVIRFWLIAALSQ